MSNKFLDIRPSNLPPNGIVSYKAGNPVITFDISEDDAAVLIGSSVRISGNLSITIDGTNTPTTTSPATGSALAMDRCLFNNRPACIIKLSDKTDNRAHKTL